MFSFDDHISDCQENTRTSYLISYSPWEKTSILRRNVDFARQISPVTITLYSYVIKEYLGLKKLIENLIKRWKRKIFILSIRKRTSTMNESTDCFIISFSIFPQNNEKNVKRNWQTKWIFIRFYVKSFKFMWKVSNSRGKFQIYVESYVVQGFLAKFLTACQFAIRLLNFK